MSSPPPTDLPDYFLQALARALPALMRLGKRTALYPAGPLSAALLESGRLGDLPIVGIADRGPSRFADGIAGHSVLTPSALFRGGVDAILICSITYHAEIFEELLTSCIKYDIDLIGLCRAAPDTTVDAGLSALAHRTPPIETVPRPISFVLAASDHGMMIVNRQDRHAHDIGAGRHEYGVGFQILEKSGFERDEMNIALALLESRRRNFGHGVVAIDGGANIGVHTLEWSRAMMSWGKIIAFEPQERLFYALAGNIALNNCRNATARYAALGATGGFVSIPEPDYDRPSSFGSFEVLQRPGRTEDIGQAIDYSRPEKQVPVIAIDDLALPRVDFLKIDVEGMEMAVLEGAANSIRGHRPQLIVEVNKTGSASVLSVLEPRGYRIYKMGVNIVALHQEDPANDEIAHALTQ